MGHAFGIYWKVAFRCDDEPGFLTSQLGAVVDRLAKLALWKELQVHGAIGKPAVKLPALAALKKKLESSRDRTLFLARGGKDALLERFGAEVRVSIEDVDGGLVLTALVKGDALARLGAAGAIDEYADAIADLTEAWRPRAQLLEAWAAPHEPGFKYPRVRPPQITKPRRVLGSVADVLDARIPDQPHEEIAVVTRALAVAELPDGVVRRQREGVVLLRWVADPGDRAAVAAACTRHERWLLDLLPSSDAAGWNAEGDELLTGNPRPAKAPFAYLTRQSLEDGDRHFGHIAVETGPKGKVDKAVWAEVVRLARTRKIGDIELTEVRLLADSRAAALALSEAGHAAGYDRVVYRDAAGKVWDPDPPGLWVD